MRHLRRVQRRVQRHRNSSHSRRTSHYRILSRKLSLVLPFRPVSSDEGTGPCGNYEIGPGRYRIRCTRGHLSPRSQDNNFIFPIQLINRARRLSRLIHMRTHLVRRRNPRYPGQFTVPEGAMRNSNHNRFTGLFVIIRRTFTVLIQDRRHVRTVLQFNRGSVSNGNGRRADLPRVTYLTIGFFSAVLRRNSVARSRTFLRGAQDQQPRGKSNGIVRVRQIFPCVLRFVCTVILSLNR